MPTHVALLRGVNVGGRNRVAMSDLSRRGNGRRLCPVPAHTGRTGTQRAGRTTGPNRRSTGRRRFRHGAQLVHRDGVAGPVPGLTGWRAEAGCRGHQ
ncbi:MAG: DUF1697 domain-containing protein [Pseudonocardia sp.]|nr:DUF1697 domain-containing protein [Pseudonocardia sp.]